MFDFHVIPIGQTFLKKNQIESNSLETCFDPVLPSSNSITEEAATICKILLGTKTSLRYYFNVKV